MLKLIYGDDKIKKDSELTDLPVFNYYKYMGSLTSPPCEENVVWFIVEDVQELGTTTINLIQDALKNPDVEFG